MKNMIYQFYNEGFATTFCIRPIKYINNKINNKSLATILVIIIKFLYTIMMLSIVTLIIYFKFFR